MNTKEAIEWLEVEKQMSYNDRTQKCTKEIIELLKQGEALKAENKELEAYRHIVSELKWKPSVLTHGMLSLWLRELEQKYFPKEVKSDES